MLTSIASAHRAAYDLGIIHRDISAGNILLYQDKDHEWYGLLNDWELSKRHNVDHGDSRQPDRTVCLVQLHSPSFHLTLLL